MTTSLDTTSISEETVTVWNGRVDIRVKVAGTGTPLVYLHPAAGLRWDPFLDHLADRFTVYAPEFPGTSAGDPYAVHELEDLGDVVLAYEELIRRLGLTRAIVVGQSFGGMLAAELAATFPASIGRLVLLDPIGLWRPDAPTANWMATPPEDLPALLFHDPGSDAAQAFLAMPDDPEIALAATAGLIWSFGCTGKFVWPIPDRGLSKRLHRIDAPTLVVWGQQDRLISASYAEDFAARVPDCRSVIIPDCGHVPQVEKLTETTAAVDAFLSRATTDPEGRGR
jgi:pimeloyl-ACP methyl ester carboxylesterase